MRRLSIVFLLSTPAFGEDVPSGAELFRFHCASCHGVAAEGDGPLGDMLTIRPPDLTALASGNDGVFPLERVLRRIDGTTEVKAHGGPMPIFGLILDGPSDVVAAPDGSDVAAPEALINIASWLRTVQK